MNKNYNVAILGARGLVGQELARILYTRRFPINQLYVVATKESVGEKVEFAGKDINITTIEDIDCSSIDIIFNCTPSTNEVLSFFCFKRNVIIDKSGALRMQTPLIVSGINTSSLIDILRNKGDSSTIISMPNCCVVAFALCLAPLVKAFDIFRIVISTYQSMSGAGRQNLENLIEESFSILSYQPKTHEVSTAFNVIPVIGGYGDESNSGEEIKVKEEIKKILNFDVPISVTCARVPVFVGHCASINIEFASQVQLEQVKKLWQSAYRCKLVEDRQAHNSLSPRAIACTDDVFIGRLRQNQDNKNIIDFWVASDNLRIGASLNAVEVAEYLIHNELL